MALTQNGPNCINYSCCIRVLNEPETVEEGEGRGNLGRSMRDIWDVHTYPPGSKLRRQAQMWVHELEQQRAGFQLDLSLRETGLVLSYGEKDRLEPIEGKLWGHSSTTAVFEKDGKKFVLLAHGNGWSMKSYM